MQPPNLRLCLKYSFSRMWHPCVTLPIRRVGCIHWYHECGGRSLTARNMCDCECEAACVLNRLFGGGSRGRLYSCGKFSVQGWQMVEVYTRVCLLEETKNVECLRGKWSNRHICCLNNIDNTGHFNPPSMTQETTHLAVLNSQLSSSSSSNNGNVSSAGGSLVHMHVQ